VTEGQLWPDLRPLPTPHPPPPTMTNFQNWCNFPPWLYTLWGERGGSELSGGIQISLSYSGKIGTHNHSLIHPLTFGSTAYPPPPPPTASTTPLPHHLPRSLLMTEDTTKFFTNKLVLVVYQWNNDICAYNMQYSYHNDQSYSRTNGLVTVSYQYSQSS
jgi:hypothetical protein